MGGILQNSISGNGCLKEARTFRVVDIFDVKNSKNILKSDVDFTKKEHPYVTAQEGNNSIIPDSNAPDDGLMQHREQQTKRLMQQVNKQKSKKGIK